ncbi:MAG: T9SS type A sorting domain-containing protein [Bacteroidetes bacterium]|nr:T9SS type A sorting domain-containing protein [Bacteroidota bacterium]
MKLLLKILIFVFFSDCFAQGETWNWYVGNNDGIAFVNGKYPQQKYFKAVGFWESTATLSDSVGNLLLYSSGNMILDKNGKTIIDTLKTHISSTQGNLFLKHPKSADLFFVSTSAHESYQFGTRFTIFSLKDDTVTLKKINILIYPNTAEKMSAVNHRNNNDIWILNHSENEDTFYLFLLKKDGMICCPIKNKCGLVYTGNGLEGAADVIFSPSGTKILNTTWYKNKTEVFEFDNQTGRMTLKVSIPSLFSLNSAFAKNEKIFYVNENTSSIVQYTIDNNYKYKSFVIKESDHEFYSLETGPDKRIYIVDISKGNYLSAILYPDSSGSKCGYKDSFLRLSKPKETPGLPNFNQSYFYTPSIDYSYEQDCRTNTIAFEGKDTIKATSFKWIFSKGAKAETQTGKDASYTFADTGKWKVSYIAVNGSRSDTVIKTITIHPKLEPGFLGKDIEYCQTIPAIHAPKNLHCIHWYNDTLKELGKTDSLKPVKEGIYYAKATNRSFCIEWDTIKILKTNPKANFETKDVCEGDSAVFVNTSANANSYTWKFGDGKTSQLKHPSHKYPITTSTTFNVTLIAQTDVCNDSVIKTVTVNQNPDADFTYKLVGSDIELKAKSGGIKYEWKFGMTDSVATSLPDYNRTINISTQKNVCLKVTNLAGCVSEKCKDVTVGIAKVIKESDFKIYPNPTKGKLTIEINRVGNYNLKIYNETGQLVLEQYIKGYQTNSIILNQAKGIFIIEITESSGINVSKKIVFE